MGHTTLHAHTRGGVISVYKDVQFNNNINNKDK